MKPKKIPAQPFWRRHLMLILGLAVAALLVHDLFGQHGFLAMRRNKQQVRQLREEIQQLNEENRRLAEEVQALKSDPKAIERIAREEMGLARPGEYIFKLPPKPAASAP
jgi:cell division protein FtsB